MLPLLVSAGPSDGKNRTAVKAPRPTTAPARAPLFLPSNRSVVASDSVQIVVAVSDASKASAIMLDGEAIETQRMQLAVSGVTRTKPGAKATARPTMVLVAAATLAPGKHVAAVGARKTEFFVDTSEDRAKAPADWPTFRPHPGEVANCALCHDLKETRDGQSLGPVREPKACFVCHDLDEFKLIHSHRVESLAACRMCHISHGGTTKAALVGKIKPLCLECHD